MVGFRQLWRSFRHAARGLARVAKEERNFRLELAAAVVVIALAFVFPLSSAERGILSLVIIIVLVLELINSIFERLADLLKPRLDSLVAEVKDIMAGAVLVSAIGSTIIGLVIFGPHLWSFLAA